MADEFQSTENSGLLKKNYKEKKMADKEKPTVFDDTPGGRFRKWTLDMVAPAKSPDRPAAAQPDKQEVEPTAEELDAARKSPGYSGNPRETAIRARNAAKKRAIANAEYDGKQGQKK